VIAVLGNTDQFGVDWQRQQQNLGPVFKYSVSNFYIGDHRLRERRCRLGSVPDELKRAVVVAVALIWSLSAIDLRTPRR
jgi:hypothetical protein